MKTKSQAETVVYERVSSRGQDLASQHADLDRWVKAQDGPVDWHRDKFSGKTMDRPGWNKVQAGILDGSVRRVVVWRLDRLGRTASGLVSLIEELGRRKVNLVSLKDGLDLSTPAGRLMANVLASVASYETEVRGERVEAGLAAARARGVKLGRPAGTGKDLKVSDEHRALIPRLRGEGQGATAIARVTGLSRQTVYRVLQQVQ
jgi:DNA invertase Pin-like site-specific DNA recombinase